jgi:hypothetical protein
MKIDLWYESYVDLAQPQHNAPLRSLINALMKSVGERGEFRIELGGALHYGTYTVTKPGETVEVRVTPLKKRLRKSLNTPKPQVIRDNIVADRLGKAAAEPKGNAQSSPPKLFIPEGIISASVTPSNPIIGDLASLLNRFACRSD